MTDIVERLRDLADPNKPHEVGKLWDGLDEAAAEIERLRKVEEHHDQAVEQAEQLEAEIERLRHASDTALHRFDGMFEQQRDEIERLRDGMREYVCTGTDHPCGCYDQFLSEKTEIERLRNELKDTGMWEAHLKNEIERLRAMRFYR